MTAPTGYQAGTAWVQVLPSFSGVQKDIEKFFRGQTVQMQVEPSVDSRAATRAVAASVKGRAVSMPIEPEVSSRAVTKAVTTAVKAADTTVTVTPKVDAAAAQRTLSAALADKELKIDLDISKVEVKFKELARNRKYTLLRIDADVDKAKRRIDELLDMDPEKTKIDIDAEVEVAKAKIAQLTSRRERVVLQTDADIRLAQLRIRQLTDEKARIRLKAEVDTAQAQAKLEQLANTAKRTGTNGTDIRVEGEDISRAIALMGQLTAAVAAVGFAAPVAAAALAAIPTAVLAAAQGITVMIAGFQGVGDAVKAMQAVDDEAVSKASTNARQRESAANRVADASRALEAAEINAGRTAIRNAQAIEAAQQRVAEARQGVTEAQMAASRRVEDAERSLAAAQADSRLAQEDLNRARADAKERLEDLRIALAGSALDEESAALAVRRARERLAAARAENRPGREPSALDLAELSLGVRQAEQSLREVRERYADLRVEAAEASRTGVEGSAEVVAAQRRVQDAAVRVGDEERALRDARVEGAREVAQAQQEVSRAQQQAAQAQQSAAWAAEDSTRAVADAQRNLAEAARAGAQQGAASMDKLSLAMGKLTPAGREFARFVQDELKPQLRSFTDAAATTMLPKVQQAFENMMVLAPGIRQAFADTGDAIGDLALRGSELVTSGPWQADFASIADRNVRLIGTLGGAGFNLATAFKDITVASGPFVDGMAAAVAASASNLETWIASKRESGELARFFAEMSVRARELWQDMKALATGIFDVVQAIAPLGRIILDVLGKVAQFVGAIAEANPVLFTIIAIGGILFSIFVSLFRAVGGLRTAVGGAVGVFQDLRGRLIGTGRAADEATRATQGLTGATGVATGASERQIGVLGRARQGLQGVRDAYVLGADNATMWASRTLGATSQVNAGLSLVPLAADKAGTAFQRLQTTGQNAMINLAGTVGGTATAIGRGLGGAVTGIVGALGGPWGLAITGATVGLGFLASAQADAAARTAQHQAHVESLTDALLASGGVVDETVRKQIILELQEKSLVDNVRTLELNLGDMVAAIGEGGDAAVKFESDLRGTGEALIENGDLAPGAAEALRRVASEMQRAGGQASDYSEVLDLVAGNFQDQTGANDEARDSYRDSLAKYLDLVGGYADSTSVMQGAADSGRDIARAQEDAASETERHNDKLKELQGTILEQIDRDLAYRQATNDLAEAHQRVVDVQNDAEATSGDLVNARLAEEQTAIRVIDTYGALAFANSTATTEAGKLRDQYIAQGEKAAELANNWKGPLPAALQTFVDKMIIAKDESGKYRLDLSKIPRDIPTTASFDATAAKAAAGEYGQWLKDYFDTITVEPKVKLPKDAPPLVLPGGTVVPPRALGVLATPYAAGGVRAMSAGTAQMVPARQPRLIGDRMHGDEAFIPVNRSRRSITILTEAAARMGFGLLPLARGAILGMAAGGVNQAGGGGGGGTATPGAALVLEPAAVEAFGAALQALAVMALVPLAAEINGTTVPAIAALEFHVGVAAVVAAQQLAAALQPLRNDFTLTAATVGLSWQTMRNASAVGVVQITAQLRTLQAGVRGTGQAFVSTGDLIRQAWSRVTEYTAGPVRAAISGPYNLGLIPAWNYLNGFFNLNRPLKPLPIPFATGGPIPGTGNRDSVLIAAMPGEYMISKPVVKKWGLENIHRAHEGAKRGGFPGLEGMFAGDEGGIYRVPGYASGGPIPEALARANVFGRKMHRKPYIWGGGSEAGTDCSGWMAMIARALMDVKPYARREWATAATAGGNPPPRFTRGIGGTFAIGVNPGVHTAGTLAGLNVESGGAHNYVAFGPPSTGADDSQFPLKFHLAELGGNFVSGGAGGGFNMSAFIRDAFNGANGRLRDYSRRFGRNAMGQASAALVRTGIDTAIGNATSSLGPTGITGDVESWRPMVLQALRMLNLPLNWADITLRRMAQESGGNPRAVNLWDSNAARGDPSKGLMQVIGSTFNAYRDLRAPNNILDPLANLLASMKYAMSRYNSLPAAYGRPGGYDTGGLLPPGYSSVYNGLSKPEAVLTDRQWQALITLANDSTAGTGSFRGNLYLSSGEFLGAVRGEIDRANTSSGRVLARGIR